MKPNRSRHDVVAPTGSRLYRRLATGVASANPPPAPIANRRYHRKARKNER